jgi:hypothetical protein
MGCLTLVGAAGADRVPTLDLYLLVPHSPSAFAGSAAAIPPAMRSAEYLVALAVLITGGTVAFCATAYRRISAQSIIDAIVRGGGFGQSQAGYGSATDCRARLAQRAVACITKRAPREARSLVCRACASRITLFRDRDLGVCYYWCRKCKRIYDGDGTLKADEIVCVLNGESGRAVSQRQGTMHINWSNTRSLCDFDRIEVQQATDGDVQRFFVQVGNDTDEIRRRRYARTEVRISDECRLSENTLRILRSRFRNVTRIPKKEASNERGQSIGSSAGSGEAAKTEPGRKTR